MSRIQALSKFGFKLDELKNEWEKVDKSLLKRDLFTSLKKGDEIEIVARNKAGFILDFRVIKPNTLDINSALNSAVTSVTNQMFQMDKERMRERAILKGQCLNLIFNNNECDLEIKEVRQDRIRLAHKLFIEIEEYDYYNW